MYKLYPFRTLISIFLVLMCSFEVNSQTLGVSPPSANQGQSLTVTFTNSLSMFGPGSPCASVTASNITFSQGASTFNPTSFTKVNSSTATSNVTVPASATAGTYNVSISGGCPLSCSNCFTVNAVILAPDLSVGLTHAGATLKRNNVENYTINYGNTGLVAATNAYILVIIPEELSYVGSSVAYSSFSNDTLRWDFASIANGTSGSISLQLKVADTLSVYGKSLKVDAEIWPMAGDLNAVNNVASRSNTVQRDQLYSIPEEAEAGQTLTVKFTGDPSYFTSASACASPTAKFTHNSGNFSFNATSVNYTAPFDSADVTISVPANAPIGDYDISFCWVNCNDCFEVLPSIALAGQNLAVYLTEYSTVRSGQNHLYQIFYQNKGVDTMNATITFVHDANFNYVNSTPAYSSKTGTQITYTINNLLPGASGSINVELELPISVSLGTTVMNTVDISPTTGDLDATDNVDTTSQTVVNSYDPNDKTAYPNDIIEENQEYITYVVRFQNTGNAPALKVVIEDVISGLLDFASIQTLTASHPYYQEIVGTNTVQWIFNDINLPDSMSDPLGSQGFVKYRVDLLNPLTKTDTITNSADIYFDANLPIITNTTKNYLAADTTTDTTIGVHRIYNDAHLSIYPNPTVGNVWIVLKDNNTSGQIMVEVYTVTGAMVMTQNANTSNNNGKMQLDISSLEPGMYMIRVKGDSWTARQRIMLLK